MKIRFVIWLLLGASIFLITGATVHEPEVKIGEAVAPQINIDGQLNSAPVGQLIFKGDSFYGLNSSGTWFPVGVPRSYVSVSSNKPGFVGDVAVLDQFPENFTYSGYGDIKFGGDGSGDYAFLNSNGVYELAVAFTNGTLNTGSINVMTTTANATGPEDPAAVLYCQNSGTTKTVWCTGTTWLAAGTTLRLVRSSGLGLPSSMSWTVTKVSN